VADRIPKVHSVLQLWYNSRANLTALPSSACEALTVWWCDVSLCLFVCAVNLSFVPWGSVECVATVTFYTKLALVFSVPPVALFLILGVPWAVLRLRNRYDHTDDRAVRDKRKVTARKCVKLAVFALSLLYPSVSQMALSYFNARTHLPIRRPTASLLFVC
jgi:hypothetical protein